jgi:nicotinate-nucleotide adenylyltransferase
MVRLATANLSGLYASGVEVERGGLSYTIDTFRRLRESEPARPYRLLLGSDAALQIESWHEAAALLGEASFVIFSRPQVTLAPGQLERLGFPAERTQVVTLETPPISGRMVRERLRRGEPVQDLLTPEVADYIRDRGLYRS